MIFKKIGEKMNADFRAGMMFAADMCSNKAHKVAIDSKPNHHGLTFSKGLAYELLDMSIDILHAIKFDETEVPL